MLAGHALRRNSDREIVVDKNDNYNEEDQKREKEGLEEKGTMINTTTTNNDNNDDDDVTKITHAHHINELLTLFPSLQRGMDVNPKFTLGPTGCEYTAGLGAFDIMGVDLVHGWLVDIDLDRELAGIIGRKSYNELVDMVIRGNEAMEIADQLTKKIANIHDNNNKTKNTKRNDNIPNHENAVDDEEEEKMKQDQDEVQSLTQITVEQDMKDGVQSMIPSTSDQSKEKELHDLHEELQKQNEIAAEGNIIKQFLDETSHQLTYVGLTELHSYLQEGHLCVFFRNNHFATLTKHEGVLYLLVTDLGYAGVNDVVWEKLDDISGDTDLYDQSFCKSQVQNMHPVSAGPNLSPEQLLAQRGQNDADFQLALKLSMNDQVNTNRFAEQEGDLIAAATQLSLQTYKNEESAIIANIDPEFSTGINESKVEDVKVNDMDASELLAFEMQKTINEEQDRQYALQLQNEINQAESSTRTRVANQQHISPQEARRRQEAKSDGCVIS